MAHGVKYRISYYRKSGGRTTVDILQRNYASSVTDIKGGMSPFESDWSGSVDELYLPTIGGGAVLNLVTIPLQLLELFTGDPQEWMVKVYDGATGTTLRWQGFVNAEIYTEQYSNPIASELSIQCNDGMSVLDTILYKNGASLYSGKQTIGQVITNILGKLEISFTTAYLSNDLKIPASYTNLFLYLDIFNENFIDESDNPMTCRQVLDGIMGGLGLIMYFEGDVIYIVDPINLHDTSKGKSYAVAGWGSETNYSLGGYLDLSAKQITWGAVGSALDIVPRVSEALVRYNPYNFAEDLYNFAEPTKWNYAGTFGTVGSIQMNTNIDYKDWTVDSASLMQLAIRKSTYTEPEYCLRLADTGQQCSYLHLGNVVSTDPILYLKISMSVFTQTKEETANIFDAGVKKDVTKVIIPVSVKVGSLYWKGSTTWEATNNSAKWQPLPVYSSSTEADHAQAKINDEWVTGNMYVTLATGATLVQGQVSIEILDSFILSNTTTYISNQVLPADKKFFNITSSVKTVSIATGATFVKLTNSSFRVTVTNFKSYIPIEAHHKLLDDAVISITTTVPSGIVVGGNYHDSSHTNYAYSSIVSETSYSVFDYVSSTDTLTFDVSTVGTAYFGGNFDHFDTGYITNLTFNYDYVAVLLFIKDVKIEVIDAYKWANIGNNGVETKSLLSTNLLGKETYIINTTVGSGPLGCSRGALKSSVISPAGDNITGLYRTADATYRPCAYRVLESFMSEYKQPRYTLSGRLNVYGQPLNVRTKLIKDVTFQGSKAFYMVSGSYKDREEMLDVTLLEVTDTRESIT